MLVLVLDFAEIGNEVFENLAPFYNWSATRLNEAPQQALTLESIRKDFSWIPRKRDWSAERVVLLILNSTGMKCQASDTTSSRTPSTSTPLQAAASLY